MSIALQFKLISGGCRVLSNPKTQLKKKNGVSDVVRSKTCAEYGIPVLHFVQLIRKNLPLCLMVLIVLLTFSFKPHLGG